MILTAPARRPKYIKFYLEGFNSPSEITFCISVKILVLSSKVKVLRKSSDVSPSIPILMNLVIVELGASIWKLPLSSCLNFPQTKSNNSSLSSILKSFTLRVLLSFSLISPFIHPLFIY